MIADLPVWIYTAELMSRWLLFKQCRTSEPALHFACQWQEI